MKASISRGIAYLVALAALGATNPARAESLTFFDALALVQSTATDTDAFFATLFTNSEPDLNYNSTSSATTWMGTLSGAGFNITYSSTNLANLPSGQVTWMSMGSVGGQTWGGNGSVTITDTSSTTFQVAFNDSVTLGSNTASINVTIPGTVVSGQFVMFGDPTNEEVDAPGTGSVNGVLLAKKIYSYSKDKNGNLVQSDVQFVPDDQAPKRFKDNFYDANGNMLPFDLAGMIVTVPEPSSILLLGLGGFAVLGYDWRCSKHRTHRYCEKS